MNNKKTNWTQILLILFIAGVAWMLLTNDTNANGLAETCTSLLSDAANEVKEATNTASQKVNSVSRTAGNSVRSAADGNSERSPARSPGVGEVTGFTISNNGGGKDFTKQEAGLQPKGQPEVVNTTKARDK